MTHQNQPKRFWKSVKKLCRARENSGAPNIDVENCKTHFKNTLQTDRFVPQANESLSTGPFDTEISEDEIVSILKSLKTNKSPGLDQITNEKTLCLHEAHPSLLKNLFNNILQRGHLPKQWNKSLIVPILKSGSPDDTDNYRGISLMPHMSKVFLSIVNRRILSGALNKKIFSQGQLGFIPGNRTSDALIILHQILDKYCHKKNSTIYSCFVDCEKAFDTVPRDKLLRKLHDMGITGKVYNIIKTCTSLTLHMFELATIILMPLK